MPIQLTMMQPKHGFIRAHEDVAARVAPDAVVSASMQRREHCIPNTILQRILERQYIFAARNLSEQVGGLHVLACEEVVHVASVTARVVAVAGGKRVGWDFQARVHCGRKGTEVDCETGNVVLVLGEWVGELCRREKCTLPKAPWSHIHHLVRRGSSCRDQRTCRYARRDRRYRPCSIRRH
jgi:hypothetical protein